MAKFIQAKGVEKEGKFLYYLTIECANMEEASRLRKGFEDVMSTENSTNNVDILMNKKMDLKW